MSNRKYDSEFCGSLPIHLINLIQPYGVLLVIDAATKKIVQASENASEIFGVSAAELVGTSVENHLDDSAVQVFREKYNSSLIYKLPSIWKIRGIEYVTLMHRKENLLLVEIDRNVYKDQEEKSFVTVFQEIKYTMELIQSSTSVEDVALTTAKELKRISGFDKVMIYRFDSDWNGNVIAEEMEDGMESYFGFTFPASDVPESARLLYLKNPYRFIPDRDYQPVKLFPVVNPVTQSFTDLSDCNLRGVVNVHLEYLKNMNVSASMSTRILKGNKLWGLIACHHRTSRNLSFELRSIFELISNVVSSRIASIENNDTHVLDSKLRENYKSIIQDAYREDLLNTLLHGSPDLMSLFNAQGVAISRKGKIYTKGSIPDSEELNELILWLHTKELKGVFYTENLSALYDNAQAFKEKVSGMMVIPVDSTIDEYVLIFRPEVVRVINWGGNPNDRIRMDADAKNYHPRSSFQKWKQLVEGTSMPWREEEIHVAENLRSFIYEFMNQTKNS